jgi:pimeloyl-ACP methyl ester carboxylesterase
LSEARAPIWYERAGTGSPPLVFVHGFACSHADWRPQLDHFAATQTVVACDLRGHGETPGDPADCSIETYGADAAALLAALNLRGAVLIGHSLGCRVVLQAALDAPGRVAGVVLIDGSRIGMGDPETAGRVMREQIRATGYGAFARRLFEEMFLPSSGVMLKNSIVERALELPAPIGTALFPRMVAWDAANIERALSTLSAPLLVVQSTNVNAQRVRVALSADETTPWLDLVRRLAPNTRIEVLAGVGHFPQLEVPEEVNRLVGDFASVCAATFMLGSASQSGSAPLA